MRKRLAALTACLLSLCTTIEACVGDSPSEEAPSVGAEAGAADTGASIDSARVDDAESASDVDSGAIDAGPCDLSKPFGQAVQVPGLASPESEENLWLSEDEKTAYVTAIRVDSGVANYRVYVTSRADRNSAFGALIPSELAGANGNDERASVSADGRLVVFASNRSGSQGFDLYSAERSSPTGTFPTPELIANVNDATSDSAPMLGASGLELLFSSGRSGTTEIYRAVRGVGAPFGAAQKIDLGGEAGYPVLTRDGLTLYFSRTVAMADIWVAKRSSINDGFGQPAPVNELNTAQHDWPDWISPDGCRLYFGSGRPGAGGYDQWVAEKPH